MSQRKVVCVTGAASGIGAAVARAFGAQGAAVAMFDRSEETLESSAAAVEQAGGSVLPIMGDVSNDTDVDRAVALTVEKLGPLRSVWRVLESRSWAASQISRWRSGGGPSMSTSPACF